MNSLFVVLMLTAIPAIVLAEGKVGTTPASPPEIKQLILMVALLDYPIEQSKVHGLLGLPESVKPSWGYGGSMTDSRGTVWYWPLSDPNCSLKVIYSHDTKETTGQYPLITSVEVVYRSPAIGDFVADPHEFPLTIAPRLKAKLRSSGLSLIEFTAPENRFKFYRTVADDIMAERKAKAAQAQSPGTRGTLPSAR